MFVVIGTTTVDLFISGAEAMPRFDGDEFTTSSLTFCRRPLTAALGGNGANTAYVLAALGAPTALCSATGTNELGAMVTGWLRERQVDLRGFLRLDDGTATTTIIMDAQRSRISFYYQGKFPEYTVDLIPVDLLQAADLLLITGYSLLPALRPSGFEVILRRAHAHGARTLLDIGPAIGDPVRLHELAPLLPQVDILLTNEHELSVCTGQAILESGVQALIDAGASAVSAKCGKGGTLIAQGEQRIHVPAFPIEAAVTVGAGDSFNAGFMLGLRRGLSLEQAARMGNAVAALVIQTGRSVLGAPALAEVEALLAR